MRANRIVSIASFCLGLLPLLGVANPADAGEKTVFIPIRWCAMQGTPAVDMPSCVGEDNHKDVLWRRHEKPTDAAYIPSCGISFRSGAQGDQEFPVITDPATTVGQTGDVIDPSVDDGAEYEAVIEECRTAWENQTMSTGEIGIIGVNVRRFTLANGNVTNTRYVTGEPTYCDDQEQPVEGHFAVIDNDFTSGSTSGGCEANVVADTNERITGHAAGHALSLEDVVDATNLMDISLSTDDLDAGDNIDTSCPVPTPAVGTLEQCDQVRLQALCHVQGTNADPPPRADLNLDARSDASPGHIDLLLYGLIDDEDHDSEGSIVWQTNEVFPSDDTPVYSFAADLDNNAATGGDPSTLVTGLILPGAELVGEVSVTIVAGSVSTSDTLWRHNGSTFVPQSTISSDAFEPVLVSESTETPYNPIIELIFDRSLLEVGGQVGPTIPVAARAQSGASSDTTPAASVFIGVPELSLCQTNKAVAEPGQQITVSASDLPANEPVHVVLGPVEVLSAGSTNGAGDFSGAFTVPVSTSLGTHVISVGLVDADLAATSECSIRVAGSIPGLTAGQVALLFGLLLVGGAALLWRRVASV